MKLYRYLNFIDDIKEQFVSLEEIRNFKENFYKLNLYSWQLDIIWEFLWGDISKNEALKMLGGKHMKNYEVKTTVKQNFNDLKDGKTYEVGDEITLKRFRYEELFAKGYVNKGKIIEEKPKFKKSKED